MKNENKAKLMKKLEMLNNKGNSQQNSTFQIKM